MRETREIYNGVTAGFRDKQLEYADITIRLDRDQYFAFVDLQENHSVEFDNDTDLLMHLIETSGHKSELVHGEYTYPDHDHRMPMMFICDHSRVLRLLDLYEHFIKYSKELRSAHGVAMLKAVREEIFEWYMFIQESDKEN